MGISDKILFTKKEKEQLNCNPKYLGSFSDKAITYRGI